RGGGRGRGGVGGGRGSRGGRGRGGGRGGGMKGGSRVVVQPHRHDGVFVAKGKEDALCTKNMVPGESVYGEKRVSVQVIRLSLSPLLVSVSGVIVDSSVWISPDDVAFILQNEDGSKVEYRVWNPFRSKLAAAILGGVDNIWIVGVPSFLDLSRRAPGTRVLYLGAASGTTVSHVSDIVGPAEQFKPSEQVTLEPFERDHACVVGGYRMPKKQKVATES
ncbi:hypothetical protein B296_00037919, partial [Ensete ventricosum]